MRTATLTLAALTVAVFLACAAGEEKPTPLADEATERERAEYVNDLISAGVATKFVDNLTAPELWVTPLFMSFDFDRKQNLVNAVFSHAFRLPKQFPADQIPAGKVLTLVDSKSGKPAGSFTKRGLSMD